MQTKSSLLARLTAFALAGLALTASSFAGPGPQPMYMMMGGTMYVVTPMAKDASSKSGCKVCTNGSVLMPGAKKPTVLKDGEMVTAEGKVMSPHALHAHGG